MRLFATGLALLLLVAPASAAAPTEGQKAEFYRVCMGIAQDETLCSCKADAAMTLIDERFMGVVIAAMKGGATQPEDAVPYNTYVAKSNQICKPNY
jgi:hypothetical protein